MSDLMSSGAARVVLGIDTAGPVVGAALWVEGELEARASWSLRIVRGADAALIPAVSELLQRVERLDRIAVSTGPGAFTGLRVGVATALGLAVARSVPVVSLSSLQARAALLRDEPSRVIALLDARKGRVYAGLFDGRGPIPGALGPERDLTLGALLDGLDDPSAWVAMGEGARVHGEALRAAGVRIGPSPDRSAAVAVARLGLSGAPVDPSAVALRYLRAPDARPLSAR